MEKRGPIFERIYKDYMRQIRSISFDRIADQLNLEIKDGALEIPFFHKRYLVGKDEITEVNGTRPIYAECVVLAKYIILCPQEPPPPFREWWTFKDFKDAAPFAGAFNSNVEKAIARNFSSRAEELKRACKALGAEQPQDISLSYEIVMKFKALPTVDVLLVFNDADEEFPAEARVLFPDNADSYLDMECLAISGWLLSDYLYIQAGGKHFTIM